VPAEEELTGWGADLTGAGAALGAALGASVAVGCALGSGCAGGAAAVNCVLVGALLTVSAGGVGAGL
jgi:hypothetical protein